jgi:hypothetical protein
MVDPERMSNAMQKKESEVDRHGRRASLPRKYKHSVSRMWHPQNAQQKPSGLSPQQVFPVLPLRPAPQNREPSHVGEAGASLRSEV